MDSAMRKIYERRRESCPKWVRLGMHLGALPIRLRVARAVAAELVALSVAHGTAGCTIEEKPSARNPSRTQWLSFAWSGLNVSVGDSS